MAETLAAAWLVGLALAFTGLSLRILRRAQQGGSASEIWISLFFLGLAFELLGYGYSFAYRDGSQGIENGLAVALSSVAILGFVRSVFRPTERWALVGVLVLGVTTPAVFVLPHLAGDPSASVRLAWTVLRATALLWAFVECARYYTVARRRIRLDLIDPVVANRFLLWSIWMGGAAFLPVAGFVVRALAMLGMGPDHTVARDFGGGTAVLALAVFPCLAVVAASLWLSFFPPTWYRHWIGQRAANAGAAVG